MPRNQSLLEPASNIIRIDDCLVLEPPLARFVPTEGIQELSALKHCDKK